MEISEKSVVTLHYRLKEGAADGQLVEETYGKNPLAFIFGIGMMIPGFEANLNGKKAGDEYAFLLNPSEAYGETNPEAIVDIPIGNFADENGKVDRDALALGQPVRMRNQEGQAFQGLIVDAGLESLKVDFNHPMAGKSLHFSGEIVEVREATQSELEHGHVHDGTHH